ncbi:TIGR03086 family metal-binding protein [Mycolicibacter minnesotensis]
MNTPTNPASDYLTDPRPLLNRALNTGGTVIAGIRPGQLTDPTPCTEMNVRTLLAHLIGVLDRITALGEGKDPFAITEAQVSEEAWSDAWAQAGKRAKAAWADDAVLQLPMALPWIQGSGAEVLTSFLSELTVHTWDVAVATDQRPDWDEAVIAAALQVIQNVLPAENRLALYEAISAATGADEVAVPFAEAVRVPEDAPAIDRLIAWNGRVPVGGS